MRLRVLAVHLAVVVAMTGPAHADPGLSSLEGLLPLYIAAFAIAILGLYVLPVWLTFRARTLSARGSLSRKKLLLLVAPAGALGFVGLVDFVNPTSLVSGIFGSLDLGLLRAVYWGHTAFSGLLVFLAFWTLRQCRRSCAP